MNIPPFSIFSATSELFVTAAVLYVVRRNWTGRTFPFALFLAVALFEGLINVMYMAARSAQASAGHAAASDLSVAMKIGFAGHGLLSVVGYLAFVVLGTLAHQEQQRGRWFFRDHPGVTWAFLVVWMVSILSGEALFVMRYFT